MYYFHYTPCQVTNHVFDYKGRTQDKRNQWSKIEDSYQANGRMTVVDTAVRRDSTGNREDEGREEEEETQPYKAER